MKKVDSFSSETSENQFLRTFLRNGRLRVNGLLNQPYHLFKFRANGTYI